MTDIEQKALALVNELQEKDGGNKYSYAHHFEALCRAIEQHEDFKQRVSDVMTYIKALYPTLPRNFNRFIIPAPKPKPKPDPLVDVLADTFGASLIDADELRAALEVRGLEIRSKNDA
jgi:hypothetical protein